MLSKMVFVITFAVAVAAVARAARRAAQRHNGTVHQLTNEVPVLVAVRAALGVVFYAALGAWLFAADRFQWAYVSVSREARVGGAVLMIATVALFWWSVGSLGANYRGGVGLYDEHELVTTGAYARVRHPIYLGFVLLMILMLPLSANWVLSLTGLLLVGSIAVIRVPIEERELQARFGSRWDAYRRRVRCLVPHVWPLQR